MTNSSAEKSLEKSSKLHVSFRKPKASIGDSKLSIKQFKTLAEAVDSLTKSITKHVNSKAEKYHAVFDIDDTLIFDMNDTKGLSNPMIIRLVSLSNYLNIEVHLVTARLEEPATRAYTLNQLKKHGLHQGSHYKTLALASETDRTDMKSVSLYKHRERHRHNSKLLFSIGDQFGDGFVLSSDQDIDTLGKKLNVNENPYLIFKVKNMDYYFLKLPDQ